MSQTQQKAVCQYCEKQTCDNLEREAILKPPTQCEAQSLFYTGNNLIFQKSYC